MRYIISAIHSISTHTVSSLGQAYFGPLVIYVTNGTLNFSALGIQTLKMHIYVPILANCATHGPNQPNDLIF